MLSFPVLLLIAIVVVVASVYFEVDAATMTADQDNFNFTTLSPSGSFYFNGKDYAVTIQVFFFDFFKSFHLIVYAINRFSQLTRRWFQHLLSKFIFNLLNFSIFATDTSSFTHHILQELESKFQERFDQLNKTLQTEYVTRVCLVAAGILC